VLLFRLVTFPDMAQPIHRYASELDPLLIRSHERAHRLSRCPWPPHQREPRSVRDAQLTEVDESESLVQGCSVLASRYASTPSRSQRSSVGRNNAVSRP
jgi:hypothetical protein